MTRSSSTLSLPRIAAAVRAWSRPDLVPIGQPVAAGGVAVGYVTEGKDLYLVAVDPATGNALWKQDASPGEITGWHAPSGPGVRVDAGVEAGRKVVPFYDSMVAKVMVWGTDREQAIHIAQVPVEMNRDDGFRARRNRRLGEIRIDAPAVGQDVDEDRFRPCKFDHVHHVGDRVGRHNDPPLAIASHRDHPG